MFLFAKKPLQKSSKKYSMLNIPIFERQFSKQRYFHVEMMH